MDKQSTLWQTLYTSAGQWLRLLWVIPVTIYIAGCTPADDGILPTLVQIPSLTPQSTRHSPTPQSTPVPPTDIPATEEVIEQTTDNNSPSITLVTEEVQEIVVATQAASDEPAASNAPGNTPASSESTSGDASIISIPAAATAESNEPPAPVRYRTEDGTLFVVVTTIHNAETMPILADAPPDEKFIALSTTLANLTGSEIVVDVSSLTLIDTQSNRYNPVYPEEVLRSPLAGATLDGASTMTGLIRFSLPPDATPHLLEWCPYNNCETETLQTRLP
jgi:hypothetical protein